MTGQEFKAIRLNWGLTQSQIASWLRVRYQTVYRWEKEGDKDIPFLAGETIEKWALERGKAIKGEKV
jgi:DNA-binding XRE family transcriptional regulator